MCYCTRVLELKNKLYKLVGEPIIVVTTSREKCKSENLNFGILTRVGNTTLTLTNFAGYTTVINLCDVIFFIFIPSECLANTCDNTVTAINSYTQSTGTIPISYLGLPFYEES